MVVAGGFLLPLVLAVVGVLLPAVVARVAPTLGRLTLALSVPLAASALLVNLFFFPGGEQVLFSVGPISATAEGLLFALEIALRVIVISGAVALFYLTTTPAQIVLDLERRGVSPRLAFVIHATANAVPAIAERAARIVAAQRARALDTEGSILNRLRGVTAIAGPVVLGSIAEVEERSIALEARAFTRPGRRSLLWSPPDSLAQRVARWLLMAGLVGLFVARFAGLL